MEKPLHKSGNILKDTVAFFKFCIKHALKKQPGLPTGKPVFRNLRIEPPNI